MFNARKWASYLESAKTPKEQQTFWEDLLGTPGTNGEGQLATEDARTFRIRSVFESFVPDGREIIDTWMRHRSAPASGLSLTEAGVETANFSRITGQIVYNTVMQAWQESEYVADRVTTNVPTTFLDGEKIPGVAVLGDDAGEVGEGQQYPFAGISGHYVETPRPTKYGLIVDVTKEAVISDRTGLVVKHAKDVTRTLRIRKEKRVLTAVLVGTSQYRRDGAAALNVYYLLADSQAWTNKLVNALVDYTDVALAENLFTGMTDSNTGEPIVVNPKFIIIDKTLKQKARNILNATEVRRASALAGAADTATHTIHTTSGNVIDNYDWLSTPYIDSLVPAAGTWYFGDPQSAFNYMEVWPITSDQAPPNSSEEFNRDVVSQYKVSEFGVPTCVEPRYMVQCPAS